MNRVSTCTDYDYEVEATYLDVWLAHSSACMPSTSLTPQSSDTVPNPLYGEVFMARVEVL